jgi:hypothetical protein
MSVNEAEWPATLKGSMSNGKSRIMKKETNLWRHLWTKASRILLVLTVLELPILAKADDVEFAITDDNQLGIIDFQTGVYTQLGTGLIVSGGSIGDMARQIGGLLYLTPVNGTLVLVNPNTLQQSLIGNMPASIMGIAFTGSGALLGAALNGTTLYNFNPATAAIQSTVTLSGPGFGSVTGNFDLKSDTNGNTYLLSGSTKIWSVNVKSGVVTNVWQSNGTYDLYCIGDEAGRLYGFTTDGHIIQINLQAGGQSLVSTQSQSSPIVAVCNGGVTAGLPTLNIQATNQNSVVLSWLAVSNQFQLQQNYNLLTTNWTTMTNIVNVSNSLNWIIVSPTNTADFFRLMQP